jgi:XTP/dITP diphosphohydrolase
MPILSRRLVVASHNPGKVREISALLAHLGISAVSAGELGLPEPEETEPTFVGNAILKARAAGEALGEMALSDDSGLEALGLGGAPGIYSARWAGPGKDFALAMSRVWQELQESGGKDLSARFVCVLALWLPGGEVQTFEGYVHGRLVWPPRGDKGFGYDPMFVPEGHDITFGEMAPEVKQPLTHRARAFAKLVDWLEQ